MTWAKTDLVPSVNPTNELETKMVVDMALISRLSLQYFYNYSRTPGNSSCEKTKNSSSLSGEFEVSGKFQQNFDQGKANLVRVSGEFA